MADRDPDELGHLQTFATPGPRRVITLDTIIADIERACPGLLEKIARRKRLENWVWRQGFGMPEAMHPVAPAGAEE